MLRKVKDFRRCSQTGVGTADDRRCGQSLALTPTSAHPRPGFQTAKNYSEPNAPPWCMSGGPQRRPAGETDRHARSELLSQGRRLPMGLPGPHECSRVHPPDCPGPVLRRLHAQPGVERVPRHPRPHLRSPLRAGLPPHARRRSGRRHLPPQAGGRRSEGRHHRPAARCPDPEERQAHRLHRGRPGLADRGQRPGPAGLPGHHLREARRRRRPDALEHPRLPPAPQRARRGDRDDHRHRGHRRPLQRPGQQHEGAAGRRVTTRSSWAAAPPRARSWTCPAARKPAPTSTSASSGWSRWPSGTSTRSASRS